MIDRCIFCKKLIGNKTNKNKSGLCGVCSDRVKQRVNYSIKKEKEKILELLENWQKQVLLVEYRKEFENPIRMEELINKIREEE